jgi:hypothetical protein
MSQKTSMVLFVLSSFFLLASFILFAQFPAEIVISYFLGGLLLLALHRFLGKAPVVLFSFSLAGTIVSMVGFFLGTRAPYPLALVFLSFGAYSFFAFVIAGVVFGFLFELLENFFDSKNAVYKKKKKR